MRSSNTILKKTTLAVMVSAALGAGVTTCNTAYATNLLQFNYTGYFRMLDPGGFPLANTSITTKGANQGETYITGTLSYDSDTGTGTGTMSPFNFFGSSIPASLPSGFTVTAIGDGTGACTTAAACGGPLLLVNMLFDWNGNNGIPVSLVWDATALFHASGNPGGTGNLGDLIPPLTFDANSTGALRGAADGTYDAGLTGPHLTSHYMDLGVVPIATTKYDTSHVCVAGGGNTGACMGQAVSGFLPLITDTTANANDYDAMPFTPPGTGALSPGIGANPMLAGPFQGYNANFDLTTVILLENPAITVHFTAPTDVTLTPSEADIGQTPATLNINLGTVTDESGTASIEYSIDGKDPTDGTKVWIPDNGGTNTITVPITQSVYSLTVYWRGTDSGISPGFHTQLVSVHVADVTAPAWVSLPGAQTLNVDSTANVSFGAATAHDLIDPNPTIEWSIDNVTWNFNDPNGNSASGFGPGLNTVYWRVTDADGNRTTGSEAVTLNLPAGITGKACDTSKFKFAGDRPMVGTFTMRDSHGSVVGTPDPAVTGVINTDPNLLCTSVDCLTIGKATLASPTPFYGFNWYATTIQLFDAGHYSFNTIQDGNPQLVMDVPQGDIGAHMLFKWGGPQSGGCGVTNCDIDVVLVWQASCGSAMLKTTDPDGDGIPGTKMVDGPFKGFNASFNMNTTGANPISDGGYVVTVPSVKNPVDGSSPLPLAPGAIASGVDPATTDSSHGVITAAQLGATNDSAVTQSCVGGCFDFVATGLAHTGDSIKVVMPLSTPIPWYSLYRKYDPTTQGWRAFDTSTGDKVETAKKVDGACPEPGSGSYTAYSNGILAGMLRPDDQCVQLTIADNGPNDNDATAMQIADPSGVGLTSGPASPEADTSNGSGAGGFDWLSLTGLLAALGKALRRGKLRS